MNIVEEIFRTADKKAVALICDEQEISYGRLSELVDAAALGIAKSAARRVGLDCPNGIAHVVLALAVVRTGKCLVPLASELTTVERQSIIQNTGLEAIVRESGTVEKLAPAGILSFDETALEKLDPAFVRFSSGTTGQSKGIVLSHQSLLERISAANRCLEISAADRIVWILPMAHHFAVSIILYLWRGATTIIAKSHLGDEVLSAARAYGGTVLYGAPFHHAMLAAETSGRDWPTLRLAVSTAASLSALTAANFQKRFGLPLSQGLGVIEIGLPFLNRASAQSKPCSIGRPMPDFQAKLIDGQLLLRGPGMLDAYLSPWQVRTDILEDGWFRTGDLVRVDEEGDYFLEGRVHSIINVAGMKCFPEEVEAVLNTHPAVRAARVIGESHPKLGSVPVAEIVPMNLVEPPAAAALALLCRTALARYKIPTQFRFVDALPRTASGKIKRVGAG